MLTTRQEPEGFKKWEDLDISDDFIFTPIMRNKRLCRTLLEMILKVRVGEIHFLTSHAKPPLAGRSRGKPPPLGQKLSHGFDFATQNPKNSQAAANIDTTTQRLGIQGFKRKRSHLHLQV